MTQSALTPSQLGQYLPRADFDEEFELPLEGPESGKGRGGGTGLQGLRLDGTKVTNAGVAKLKAALWRMCHIGR